ncbi:unnamed protein product [Adineta ricciae]|uniref:NHL repeat containing protein-like protein n=1 Tax=Adineta ricciae TaxID=249248 RepID=A0A814B1H8_ADIRI|nr:unnamed protein product [Adineta ricciae]
MINFHPKQLWRIAVFMVIYSSKTCSLLTLCPTATWNPNATTVAGSKSGSSGSTSTRLYYPSDVCVVNNSVFYVLDSSNYRVQRFSNSTTGITVINGTSGAGTNQFYSMNDMSIDSNGNIYILDGDNARVTKWLPSASSGTIVAGGNGVGSDTNQFDGAMGMFMDTSATTIWIADTNNHRIVKWTSPTTSTVVCGGYGTENNQLIYPFGVYVDANDANALYVADTGNHRIQKFLTGATTGVTVAGITQYYGYGLNQLRRPSAVMVDNNQNMFIVDTNNNRIMKWTVGASSGMIITGYSSSGTQAYQFYKPAHLDFDSNGSLYVADEYNHRIQKLAMSCATANNVSMTTPASTTRMPDTNLSCSLTPYVFNATTIAGSYLGYYGSDENYLDSPYDALIDKNGMLYVADSDNCRVQRFLPGSTSGTTVVNGSSGSALNQFGSLDGLNVDDSGNIFVLDAGNNRVVKWAPGASSGVVVAGNNGSGSGTSQLNSPYGIFLETNTSIVWIADTSNHRIVRWTPSATTGMVVCGSSGSTADKFRYPYGIFVDTSDSNTFYVADTNNHRIQKWLWGAGNGTTVAGQTSVCGSDVSLLCYPVAVVKDQNGYIFIADNSNHRVMRWMIGASFGMMVAGDSAYGVLPSQLLYPYNVKLDPTGAIIVTDSSNNRIQKFSLRCSAASSSVTSAVSGSTTPSVSVSRSTSAGGSTPSPSSSSPSSSPPSSSSSSSSSSTPRSSTLSVSSSSTATAVSMVSSARTNGTSMIRPTTTYPASSSFAQIQQYSQYLLIIAYGIIILFN